MKPRLIELEDELEKIPGVKSVRVYGVDGPTEIHVVASPERPAKQVVRDVQALASAGMGVTIDHRIVSVVQPENGQQAQSASSPRPSLQRVVVTTEGDRVSIEARLSWSPGITTSGVAGAEKGLEARARAGAAAVAKAISSHLDDVDVEVAQARLHPLDGREVVLVAIRMAGDSVRHDLSGTAYVDDDVATAAARAALDALNRKIS